MTGNENIDNLKKRLLDAVLMDELFKDPEIVEAQKKKGEQQEKIVRGMNDIPVKKMLLATQFIKDNLLPRVAKKGGEKNPDYVFFSELITLLLWSVLVVDRFDILKGELSKYKTYNALFRQHIELLEAELQKYTTLEDLFLSDSLNRYADAIKARVEAELRRKGG